MTRKVVSPIALDKSINTTEQTPRNIADVLAQQLAAIKTAIESGNGNLEAAFVCYYGVTTATQIKDAIEDGKVPYFYYNGAVAQLWKVETDKYTFRTTNTRSVEGQTILDVVDYVVNGSVWSTITREVSGGSSSGQSYIASVNSLADFDTTGKSGMQDLVSVANVPADGVYQVSVMLHITPKTASATKSDLVFHFTSGDGTGWPNHTFHAVVDDSQTFAQQLSFSTSVSLKAGQNTLRIQCGGLNTEYLVYVDELTLAQLVNGVYHNGDDFDEVHTLPEAAGFNNDDGVLVDGATGGPRFMLWRTLANKVLGFIKSLSTTITSFRTGDVIPVDGPSGTAKMSKDDLLAETAQNANEQTALSSIKMEQGGIITDGSLVSNSIRIRSADYIAGNVKLVAPAGFRFISIFYYDENTLAFSSSVDINEEANIGREGYVAKFTMAKTDTTQNITPEEVQIYNDRFALSDELDAVKTETENLRKDDYSISTPLVWNDGYVDWHNGDVVAGSGYSYCDKVEIDSFVYDKLLVYAKAYEDGNAGIAFYDENEVFLYGEPHFGGTGTSVQMSQHTIPQNAKYFSFSTKTDAVATSRYILDGSIEEAIDAVGDYNANPFESQFVSYGIDSRGNYYESNYFWALKNPLPQNVDGFWIADGYKATIVKTNKSSGVVTRDVWKTSSDGYYKLNHDVYAYRVYVSKISEVSNSTYSGVYALIFKRVGCVAVREDIDELHEADRYYHTLAKCAIKRKYEIGFANSDDYLHLSTYDGSGQFVHPKVLYKDAGIFGHKYWMAYTPYPNADVSKENPCVAFSDDGVNWTNISANPLDLPDDNGTVNYNSDTHLVYREDTKTLECWYRNADSTNQVEKIYRRTTTDGVNWSARELLKQTNGLSNLLSPAIIYDADNHRYKIWVVCASGGYHLDYYESTSGNSWSFIKELHFTFDYNGETYTLWHVDVDWIDNRYRVLCMCDDANGVGMLFYTSSYSNANYDTPEPVMVGRAGRWDLRLYRSCLVKCGNMYRIYYSGVNKVTGTREYRVGISESDGLGKFVGFVID